MNRFLFAASLSLLLLTTCAWAQEEPAELPSPTAEPEAYEAARTKNFKEANIPDKAFSFTIEPLAFRKKNFRKPNPTSLAPGKTASTQDPSFSGIVFSADKILFRLPGVFSIGLDAGLYGSPSTEGYNGLSVGLVSAGASAQYQLMAVERQWIIPTGRGSIEVYKPLFKYEGNKPKYVPTVARADIGALIYLNFLDSDASASLKADYDVKRLYLSAYYSFAHDFSGGEVLLGEHTWRAGFRFEY